MYLKFIVWNCKDWPFVSQSRWLLDRTKKAHIKIWIFTVPCRGNKNTILFAPRSLMHNEDLELLCWSPTIYSLQPLLQNRTGILQCSGLQYWHCSLLTCYLQHLILVAVFKKCGLWFMPCDCWGLFERTELCELSLQSLSWIRAFAVSLST